MMLQAMCVDLSNNLMTVSGCHIKKKRKKLYNPDNDDIYLKNFANTIVTPCKNKILIDNSKIPLENSNDCQQITENLERDPFDDSASDVQQKRKKHKQSNTNKNKESISAEENSLVDVSNHKTKVDVQKLKGSSKKRKNNMHKAYIFTEENNATEIPNEKKQCTESFWTVRQAKNKHIESIKNKSNELIVTDQNNDVINEGNNFRTSFSNEQNARKKLIEFKNSMYEKSDFTRKNCAVEEDEHQFIVKSFFDLQKTKKNHKISKKIKDVEPMFPEENNSAKISTREFFNESLSNVLEIKKKKHKKSNKNRAKEPFFIEVQNVVSSEEVQSVDIWDVQQGGKNHKSKKNKVQKSTDENTVVKVASDKNQSVHSFHGLKKIRKKHKKSKKSKEKEPTIMEERNIVELGNKLKNLPFEDNQSVDAFCNVQLDEKKHKKSKKKEDKLLKTTDENNVVKITNDQNQSVHSFCDVKKIKKKHKKSKKNEDKEPTIMEGRNIVELGNKLGNLPVEENQSVDSLCNKQHVKKKHKKSESNMDEETHTESSIEISVVNSDFDNTFYDLKQLRKKHKKLKRYKDKELSFSIENSVADTLNKKCMIGDLLCNVQQLKHIEHENNTREEPTVSEENNVFNISSQNDKSIFVEKFSLGNQMMKNVQKSARRAEHLSSSNVINQLQNISEMSYINNLSNDVNKNSHNNENDNLIEGLQETDSFDLDVYEEPVDFDIPPLHALETIHSLTENQKNELLSQGVTIKTGRFTHEEDKILLRNFENFAETHGTLDVCHIFGIGLVSKNPKIQRFLKATHFYVRLGKGLKDRTLSSIYKRARLLLHPYKNNGKLSQTEVEDVKRLRTALKKKWTYIGENLEQSADKCLQTLRWHGKSISRGKWTVEEEKKLIAAMEKVIGSSDLSCDKVKKISWEKIATYVPSKNSTQCRMHWAYHLGWKSDTERSKWNKSCYEKLIEILRKDWYVEDTSKIDWFKIYEFFKNVSPSPIYVQKRWLYLKTKIHDFKKKDYKTILDELCDLYKVSVNETFSAPFSSSAINRRLSQSITNMKKSLENR